MLCNFCDTLAHLSAGRLQIFHAKGNLLFNCTGNNLLIGVLQHRTHHLRKVAEPAIAETLPGYEASLFNAMVAPAATPKVIIGRMHAEIAKIVQRPDLRTRFAQLGTDLAASASPEEFTAFMKSDYTKWARVIRDAGIRAE